VTLQPWLRAGDAGAPLAEVAALAPLLRNALRGAVVAASDDGSDDGNDGSNSDDGSNSGISPSSSSSSSSSNSSSGSGSGSGHRGCVWLAVRGRSAPFAATFPQPSGSDGSLRTAVLYRITAATAIHVAGNLPALSLHGAGGKADAGRAPAAAFGAKGGGGGSTELGSGLRNEWSGVGGLGKQIAILREAIELPLRNPEVREASKFLTAMVVVVVVVWLR
jgi:hypothetical protein